MPRTVRKNILLNLNQLAANQLFGFILFLVLSRTLAKEDFGTLNWALSVLLLSFSVLTFGIDQLMVKKIASGEALSSLLSCFLVHSAITGLLFWILCAAFLIFFHPSPGVQLVCYLGVGKLFLSLSGPYKQAANGLEYFKELGQMSIISSASKAMLALILYIFHAISLTNIVAIFIAGDLAEFIFSIYKAERVLPRQLKWHFDFRMYQNLLREALPQLGVVILAAAIARLDWIYIGLFRTQSELAEYSFAYKLFELSSLPLLVVAPLLVPLFSRIQRAMIHPDQVDLLFVFRIQMIIASLTILVLALSWTPLIDSFSGGKYGQVNQVTIFILSLCLPFLYLNNFLWSFHFAQGHLKLIFQSFLFSFGINLFTLPLFCSTWGKEGAAAAYLLTIISQSIFYSQRSRLLSKREVWKSITVSLLFACAGYYLVQNLFTQVWVMIVFAVLFYIAGLVATLQLVRGDWLRLKKVLAW